MILGLIQFVVRRSSKLRAIMLGTMKQTLPRSVITAGRMSCPSATSVRLPFRPSSRPTHLRSEFHGQSTSSRGLCASFAGLQLQAPRRVCGPQRTGFMVQANAKNCIGNTLRGSKRKRARVSGFRTRRLTVGGRKVLAARRKKGRKVLVPASNYSRK